MNRTELMNVSEFAASLRVTTACIRRWILERRITVVKIGRLVKIPRNEIDRVINAGLRPARSAQSIASKESK